MPSRSSASSSKQTGIKVRAVYDSEAVKTVGLANRLLAERSHPQCDVFWGNEELRTRQLAAQDVFRETNGWAAFGYRSRRIVINTNQLSLAAAPRSLLELTNDAWRGKVALAYPQFGTTATHFHALRQHWGDERWQAWCRALAANKPLLRGWQFRGGENGRPGRGLDWPDRFGRYRRRAARGSAGRGVADDRGDAADSQHRRPWCAARRIRKRRSGCLSICRRREVVRAAGRGSRAGRALCQRSLSAHAQGELGCPAARSGGHTTDRS